MRSVQLATACHGKASETKPQKRERGRLRHALELTADFTTREFRVMDIQIRHTGIQVRKEISYGNAHRSVVSVKV